MTIESIQEGDLIVVKNSIDEGLPDGLYRAGPVSTGSDDIEDVPGEPEADDADSPPVALPADANDGPVPLQAGEET